MKSLPPHDVWWKARRLEQFHLEQSQYGTEARRAILAAWDELNPEPPKKRSSKMLANAGIEPSK